MGLDMWLFRTLRVPRLSLDGYWDAENALDKHGPLGLHTPELLAVHPDAVALAPAVLVKQYANGGFTVATIFDKVAYWSKANAVHRWFVTHVHDGQDDSCWSAEVPRSTLEELLDTVETVLLNPQSAARLLPTQAGFFFGSTDYDGTYRCDLEDARDQLRTVLSSTDFDRQIVFYHCWW